MAKSNTGQIVLIGAIGLAAVYMLTRSKSTTPTSYYPTQPTTQQQQNQLMQWAQTQSAASTIMNIIQGLDWNGIANMWTSIFGSGSSSGDYSGGGTDNPTNPYINYDPYNYNDTDIYT